MFTAQQSIALRGATEHREDLDQISDINRGNFLELLSLRARDVPWLREKLSSQLKAHFSWTSPMIQNELLSLLAKATIDRVQTDVLNAQYFSIIADETSDISRDEQLSVCLSFMSNGVKKEKFVGFFKV